MARSRPKAQCGNPYAEDILGTVYFNAWGTSYDASRAVYWLRKASAQGFGLAEAELGIAYVYGQGVHQDYRQALAL